MCVTKDPSFVKGYLRLVAAQVEMRFLDEAEATLKTVEKLEPENINIPKYRRELKKAKQDLMKSVKPRQQYDESQLKELMKLKDQIQTLSKDLTQVNGRLDNNSRDVRITASAKFQVEKVDETANFYSSVGKAYLRSSKPEVVQRLDDDTEFMQKQIKDLNDRKQFLERRLTELMRDRQDIIMSK
jgi:chaperonin cofactor prefoldin